MTLRSLIAVLALAACPSVALSAPAPKWVVETSLSSVSFVTDLGGDRVTGHFRTWDASIRFDPANLQGSSVDARILVGSVATGNADQEQALPSATFFDAAKFPTAEYSAHSFRALGGGRFEAQGALSMRGVTRSVTLPFLLTISGAEAQMKGQASVSRLAFGVGQNEWKATDTLPDLVTVQVTIRARRQP